MKNLILGVIHFLFGRQERSAGRARLELPVLGVVEFWSKPKVFGQQFLRWYAFVDLATGPADRINDCVILLRLQDGKMVRAPKVRFVDADGRPGKEMLHFHLYTAMVQTGLMIKSVLLLDPEHWLIHEAIMGKDAVYVESGDTLNLELKVSRKDFD